MKRHYVNNQPSLMQTRWVASKLDGVCLINRSLNLSTTNRTVTCPTHKEGMKLKTLLATLLGTFLLQHMAFCQTNVVMPDQSAVAAVTNEVAADAVTNVPALAVAATNQPDVVVASNAPVEAVAAEASAATNAPAPEAVNIPLIQFQEVPITTAIENLARQANINYLLDPKIGYGQPDANGQIKPEPTLSIRWENITAAHALAALLDNYGLQMVADSKTKIVRITIKDPAAPPPLVTRVVQLKYSSVSNMMGATSSALTDKRSKVVPDTRTSQLIVVATEPEQASVEILVNQLDKPTRQVLIETRLVEISDNPTTRKGIDWRGTLQGQNVTFGNSLIDPQTTTTPGFNNFPGGQALGAPGVVANTGGGFGSVGFLNADGLSAVISFINSSADAQIVSTPRLVTLDNEAATISVTHQVPVFNVTAGSANNSGGSSVTYSNVGTTLTVTPRISANDNIWLKVVPEVSNQGADQKQSVGGGSSVSGIQVLSAPTFDVRTITTQVIIPNANTLVMGGLVLDNPVSETTKVPVLGDIPYLGHAFRSETKSTDKRDLVIFITPTIVKDQDFQLHPNNFLATQPDAKRPVIMDPESAWNNTEPSDWSNPKTALIPTR
ncbi:MAG: secretin N-terminal domain-containing protein [Verrucomicrobiales bacterium]|nr:secretin N-terminal domain-containing protein [Verrucomicrobiales bacterium]